MLAIVSLGCHASVTPTHAQLQRSSLSNKEGKDEGAEMADA